MLPNRELATLLREAARQVAWGIEPTWDVVTAAIERHRTRSFQLLPIDVKVHILRFAFPFPFALHTPALSLGRVFLQNSRAGMRAWLGDNAFGEKRALAALLQRAKEQIAPSLSLLQSNAHIFIATSRKRYAVGFWQDGELFGTYRFVDDADVQKIVDLHGGGDAIYVEAHRSVPAARYEPTHFAGSTFPIGVTFNNRFHPIHVVEDTCMQRICVSVERAAHALHVPECGSAGAGM